MANEDGALLEELAKCSETSLCFLFLNNRAYSDYLHIFQEDRQHDALDQVPLLDINYEKAFQKEYSRLEHHVLSCDSCLKYHAENPHVEADRILRLFFDDLSEDVKKRRDDFNLSEEFKKRHDAFIKRLKGEGQ